MISETFAFGDSPLHRLDPRVRVVAAALFSIIAAVSNGFAAVCPAMVLALVLTAMARLPLRLVMARLAVVNGLILFIWLFLPWTYKGTPVLELGPLVFSLEGIRLCALITIKSNAILCALIALAATMPIATLGHALHCLRVPDKLVHLLLMTYRYIFVIEAEYQQLIRAARIRCFTPKTNLHTYKTYAYLVGMLFVRASARGERVHQAMICRGFNGKFRCLHEFAFTKSDLAWSAAMAVSLTALGVLEWAPIIS
ncbi:MAG: cobalt ECF transporter T component CbiQ [Desulfosalsimonadaceae bacterium]